MQTEDGYIHYLLVDRNKAERELAFIEQQMAKIGERNNKLEKTTYVVPWMVKVGMIRALTPFFAAGLEEGEQPEGLLRIDREGQGYAILSKEIYSTKPLFDDAVFFQSRSPPPHTPPLATDSAIVTVAQGNYAYSANILLKNETYLTIGTSLGLLARQLALSTNKMIFLNVNQKFWLGFDRSGTKLPQEKIANIIATQDLSQSTGSIHIEGKPFFYAKIISLEGGNLSFYDIQALEGETTILNTLHALENKLSNRISLQLFLISLGTMVIFLIFIGRFSYTVISPITKLAESTLFVVAGHYGEVVLPDMGDRKDEVAILTRAFGEMVSGLQEREKIRGVLDKVVSKDVADEILKTHIHLGEKIGL